MESKTCGGGRGNSGFLTLLYYPEDQSSDTKPGGIRLSYMQCLRDTPPQPPTAEGGFITCGLGSVSADFYDMWNEPVWTKLLANADNDVMAMLNAGLTDGSIGLRKIIKSPTGILRARAYHSLAAAQGDERCIGFGKDGSGIWGPKQLTFTYTHTTML